MSNWAKIVLVLALLWAVILFIVIIIKFTS